MASCNYLVFLAAVSFFFVNFPLPPGHFGRDALTAENREWHRAKGIFRYLFQFELD